MELRTRKIWLAALALALLGHLVLFPISIEWKKEISEPSLEVVSIAPEELEALRKSLQTKTKEPSNIVVPKHAPQESVDAPEDARYISERNIRVEKEQRARSGGVLPDHAAGGKKSAPPPVWAPQSTSSPRTEQLPQQGDGREESQDTEQAILDKSLPEGTRTLLNARESVYYSFYFRIRESVGLLWQSLVRQEVERLDLAPGEYRTAVEVVLSSSGDLLDVRVLESAGYPGLDSAVIQSWKRVKRFPNPPKGLLEADGRIRLLWTFSVDMGSRGGIHFVPPRRILREDDLYR